MIFTGEDYEKLNSISFSDFLPSTLYLHINISQTLQQWILSAIEAYGCGAVSGKGKNSSHFWGKSDRKCVGWCCIAPYTEAFSFSKLLIATCRTNLSSKLSSHWLVTDIFVTGEWPNRRHDMDSATRECLERGSQGTIGVRCSKVFLFLSIFLFILKSFFFCFPCFCRIWREIPGANGFGGASEARSSFRELWELCSITGLVFRIRSPVAFQKIIILCFRSRATVTWLADQRISKLSRECVLWRGYVEIWNRILIYGHRRN